MIDRGDAGLGEGVRAAFPSGVSSVGNWSCGRVDMLNLVPVEMMLDALDRDDAISAPPSSSSSWTGLSA